MVISGEVVLYSKSQDEILRKMSAYDNENSMTYIRYAGKLPEGVNVVL